MNVKSEPISVSSMICNFDCLFLFFVCVGHDLTVLLFFMFVFVLQGMFEPYLKGFFVHSSDPTHIRLLKV